MLLLFNIVLFGFFQEATTTAVTSIVGQEAVVRKTQFPRLVIPLAVVLTRLFNLGAEPGRGVRVHPRPGASTRTWTWLLFPLVLVALFVFTAAVSMIVSSLYPRFRDMAIIWTVAGDGAVLRHAGALPARGRAGDDAATCSMLNPLTPLFELARVWVIDPSAPGPVEAAGGWALLPCRSRSTSAVCVLAVWVFNREAPRIAEQL